MGQPNNPLYEGSKQGKPPFLIAQSTLARRHPRADTA
jgi:hypothetical protein